MVNAQLHTDGAQPVVEEAPGSISISDEAPREPTVSPGVERTQPLGTAATLDDSFDELSGSGDDDDAGAPKAIAGNVSLATPITGGTEPTGGTLVTGPTGSLRPSELFSVDAEDQRTGTRDVAIMGGVGAAALVLLLLLAFAMTAEPTKPAAEALPEPAQQPTPMGAKPAVELPPELADTTPDEEGSSGDDAEVSDEASADVQRDERAAPSASASLSAMPKAPPPVRRPPPRRRTPSNDWGY
jgi:hypothetical protein